MAVPEGIPEAPEPFDVVVVGAGSGGLTVAIGMARLGRRVALVERGDVGGDCTNTGCIPSKTLIDLAKTTRRARAREVLAEVRRRRDALRRHEERTLAALPRLELVRGEARLEPRPGGVPLVAITPGSGRERRLGARHVVIATGSAPVLVDVPGLPPDLTLTNATLFDLESPPARLAVIGAGAVGCEMAFAFARLGSAVTLIDRAARVLPQGEADASRVVHGALERAGVRVLTDAAVTHFEPERNALHALATGEPVVLEGVERILMACGRRPGTAGLGLERCGARLDSGAVATDSDHRTGVRGLFAIGDVTGRVESTHAANVQGRRLVRRLALPLPLLPEGDYPSVTFTDPEVGQIGPTVEALRRRFASELLVTHRIELAETDRGLTLGLDEGFVSITAMRLTGTVLAATVVAPAAGEMIHLLTLAQRRRTSLWRLSRLVVAYPALTEAVRMAADAFAFDTLANLPRELTRYARLRWRSPHQSERAPL